MAAPTRVLSGLQLMVQQLADKRPTLEYLDEKLFPNDGPKAKSLIEIVGPPDSGKSQLLWHLMARCLPPTYCGGKYCDIIFINLSNKFDARHFLTYLRKIISESGAKCSEQEMDSIIGKCMDSVTILNCYSMEEFNLCFDTMEDILFENQNVALIALDSLEAFYWLDAQEKPLKMNTYYLKILSKLKKICDDHNVNCAYTVDSSMALKVTSVDKQRKKLVIDNVLKMKVSLEGCRTVNEQPFIIDNSGLHLI